MFKLLKFIFIAIILYNLWVIFFGKAGLLACINVAKKITQTKERIQQMLQENKELERKIELLIKNDPEFIEKEARKYNLIKPNEKIVKIVPPPTN